MNNPIKAYLLLSLLLIAEYGMAQKEKEKAVKPIPEPKSFVTEHDIMNGGQTISYRAIASEMYLKRKFKSCS